MTMNQEQFDGLVQRLEGYARRQPSTYRFQVGLLALLGYGYIFLVLAVLLALIGLLVLMVRHNS